MTAKDSKVTKAAKHLAKYLGTSIHKDFLSHRSSSWQHTLHVCKYEESMQKVCNYLIPGPEVWWKEANNRYTFLDGGEDPCTFPRQGPNAAPLSQYQHQNDGNRKDQAMERVTRHQDSTTSTENQYLQ